VRRRVIRRFGTLSLVVRKPDAVVGFGYVEPEGHPSDVSHVRRKVVMYAVVRTYSGQGASELFNLLGQREEDVRALISGVPGFVSYAAVRSGDGGVTMTVCDDKAGTDESSRRAAEWVKENVSATVNPPAITEGNTVLQFGS
jgi:hypothetical protein